MLPMLEYIEYLNLPVKISLILAAAFLLMQIVGEIMELKGKVVPEFVKIRKIFTRKKREKEEANQTLQEVKQLLSDVNSHYSDDNISKRNHWMQWVNDRAIAYDKSIIEINNTLSDVTRALKDNTRLTEELFIQHSRDRIIDFATKVVDEQVPVSREEFNRIMKVYNNYETYLGDHGMTNGEIDIAYRIIKESYEQHMRNHSFIEDVRGYV